MVDDPIIHMPKKLRLFSATALLFSAFVFIGFAYYLSVKEDSQSIILIVMSLVQLLFTGFGILIIFGFSQKSLSFSDLSKKGGEFLSKEIPDKIREIHFEKPVPKNVGSSEFISESAVEVGHYNGDYRADYWIHVPKIGSLLIDVNLNVRQALIVIKIPITSKGNFNTAYEVIEAWKIPKPFSFASGGRLPDKSVDIKSVKKDYFLNSEAIHVYLKAEFEEKFLVTPSERLMCAQAISAIVRDFFVVSRDKNFNLNIEFSKPK